MWGIRLVRRATPLITRGFVNDHGRKRHGRKFAMTVARPLLAMGTATVGCLCMWHWSKSARAKEGERESGGTRFVLYQYSNCPFCSKVRAYLHCSGEQFHVVEVNPITKQETKAVSDYKKVPMLVADGIVLKESSVITSILHTHLTTGTPISEVVELYPLVNVGHEATNTVSIRNKGTEEGQGKVKEYIYSVYCDLYTAYQRYKLGKEKKDYPNKYRIMGYDPDQHQEMLREAKWRKWLDTHFVHLISPNVYRTWGEALTAFDYFTTSGNFSDFEKTYIRHIGAAAMYMIGRRLKKRHNLDVDVRVDLYSGINQWLRALNGEKFHGGNTPNLADIDMFGMCSAFHGMPCWEDAVQNTKIEKWYNRMERHLQKKSAIGLTSANPTLSTSSANSESDIAAV